MRRLLSLVLLTIVLAASLATAADKNTITLYGKVKTALTKTDLTDAYVLWPDSTGEGVDSIKCDKGRRWNGSEVITSSDFYVQVPRVDSTYVFDIVCEGYMPKTMTFTVEKLGKRETYRELPLVLLERAPHKLKDVTVTASKIKFYNKGDTVVFNADAFQLAEGSMLDGLISQLPGVELNDDGQIKVNGEYVESLLLDGKEFFDGNNQLMLENIAAYTVKNVEVYKGQNKKEKWTGDESGPKHLTMDVKLKKEYNAGWIINLQGGAGTEDRYMGRLFAQWFNSTQRFSLIGNINNLNDNRRPGKADSWTPDMMPDGTRRYRLAAAEYSFENPEETVQLDARATFEQTLTNEFTTTDRTNFFTDSRTYENSYKRAKAKDTRFNSWASLWLRDDKRYGYLNLTANYRNKTNDGSDLSASFDTEHKDIDMEVVETLYTEADPSLLESVINRAATRTSGSMKNIDLRATPGIGIKLPGSGDRISFETYIRYNRQKEERWNDYTINYGADPNPAVRRRQYFDNSPNHTLTSVNNLSYNMQLDHMYLRLNYEYRFSDQEKDSYMYALERLEDMGMFGELPAGYLDTFDPANSYTSRLIENSHSIQPYFQYYLRNDKLSFWTYVCPTLSMKHQHLDYWRGGRSQLIRQTNYIATIGNYRCMASIDFGPEKSEGEEKPGRTNFRHGLEYRLIVDPTTPDPFDRLDVINDTDPLNITLGNDNLLTAYQIRNELRYSYEPKRPNHPISNYVDLKYGITKNAIVRGFVYDSSTGVRTTRSYNVDGNRTASLANTFKLQFGRRDQFTLSSITDASIQRYSDMVGYDTPEPLPSQVDTRLIGEKLNFTWQIGKQSITARGSYTGRHSTSDREDFAPINAHHFSYGLNGDFKLPAGFGISTDFTVYTRRGYGSKELDTNDAIWNLRLSYNPPRARRWVFNLDGFDMLHQLSNVNYAVNATGRVISYTNTLPRYILLTVQYRLNIQPKKK